jgi:restriction system protein
LMRPLLVYAQDGAEKNIGDAIKALADDFHLTDQERHQLLPSKKQTTLQNRVYWARYYLDRAGAVKKTGRSQFIITDRGRELVEKYPKRVDMGVLNQFPEFVAFRSVTPGDALGDSDHIKLKPPQTVSPATPEEAIQKAEEEILQNLRSQLLDHVLTLSPTFFEQLVLDLIVAMKYGGTSGAIAERTGGSGDEGFDGIVNEDPLGLGKIYLQAKRYAKDNTVGRPMIQQFAGALVGKGASKGVFITTSSFSAQAIEFAKHLPQRVVLIDGENLARLMVQYGVGVHVESIVQIKRIDLDYFEEPEG